MRNERGSILVLTLITFVVLMILGICALNLAMAENKQAILHQHRTQAYYIARTGAEAVEAAILEMGDEELGILTSQLNDGTIDINEISMDIGNAHVTLSLDNENGDLIINSLGKFKTKPGREIQNTVTKVMKSGAVSLGGFDIMHTVFSHGDIGLHNSAEIKGDVGTNGLVTTKGNPTITGRIDILDINRAKVEENLGSKFHDQIDSSRFEPIIYEDFDFPEIPPNNFIRYLEIAGNSKGTIDESGDYNNINVGNSATLTIDASTSEIILNTKEFEIKNSGKVKIKGNNKVTIYVENIKFSNSSSIEYEDGDSLVDIYHYGNNGVDLRNHVKVRFNLYIKKADLVLHNSSELKGNVFSNGGSVDLSNSGEFRGLLYAPNAEVLINNSGKFYGAIIGDSVELKNSAYVEHDEYYAGGGIEPIISHIYYESGYYK